MPRAAPGPVAGQGGSLPAGFGSYLRFEGTGAGRVDRVEIPVDGPGAPDVGAGAFTVELWLRGTRDQNRTGVLTCGATYGWITGHVVVDRDRWPWSGPDGHDWGLSVGADGSVAFGADDAVEAHTVCTAGVDVLDGRWHHVAAQRRSTVLELWVDGSRVASGTAPAGDLRYPDGAPGARDTDPYLVLGAEKHDAGSAYPSFSGSIDELRLSPVARYSVDFAVPAGPFVLDGSTAALYHFDEGSGSTAAASPTATAVAVLRRSASGAPVWMHH